MVDAWTIVAVMDAIAIDHQSTKCCSSGRPGAAASVELHTRQAFGDCLQPLDEKLQVDPMRKAEGRSGDRCCRDIGGQLGGGSERQF